MTDRHTTLYINDITPVNFCGKTIAWQMDTDGAYEKPFETTPTTGEHDYNTCKACQSVFKELIKRLKEKFDGSRGKKAFPLCCDGHANLNEIKEFDRAYYVVIPEMVAKKILYTNQHIINFHNKENFYKEITDYIDYIVESFGRMPKNCGEPLFLGDYFYYVDDLLVRNKDIPKKKKDAIIAFLKAYRTPNENSKTDLNILMSTYEKWFKIFPFEISYFAKLKPYYENSLPILNGQPEVNKYLGMAKAKVHTKQGLVNVLLNLTNKLLTDINSHSLYEKGELTEPQKVKLEIVINERKLKLKQGYLNKSIGEDKQYKKILKEWYKDEKKFIDEVTPLLKDNAPKVDEKKLFNLDKWKFSADFYLMTDEKFKEIIFKRYNKHYTDEQLNQVIEKFKMENTSVKKQEAQEKLNAKAYLDGSSLYNYEGFKKSMTISSDNRYYNTLIRHWDETQKNYIKENGLQEVSKGLDFLFSTYLGKIFTIYKHAFKYHEHGNIKEITNITIKKARFDCLMNEQTDHFISNIESETVKGNGQLALRRKKYVLLLFKNLESFLSNSSIDFKKSPFLDIFTKSKEKIQNISFEEIKFLNTPTEEPPTKKEHNDYKWVEVKPQPFENLTEKQKKNRIAIELIGENNFRTTSIVYHHIEDVLQKYSITNIEAKDILLTMRGSFSSESNKWVIPKIIDYLKEVKYNNKPKNTVNKESPITFEELFYNKKNAEVCLNILRELEFIDGLNNYIGKNKGIFQLWIQVLKTYNPKPLIKHFPDKVYKDLLNKTINGLNLSKDASEFRKQYVTLEKNNTKLDIKTILSQYSQDGKLGK